jgi:hypothetical protein
MRVGSEGEFFILLDRERLAHRRLNTDVDKPIRQTTG